MSLLTRSDSKKRTFSDEKMKFAPYDDIADEYYDEFHKTCRNFDYTTLKGLERIRSRVPADGVVLDIGSGRGRCGEFLGIDASRVIQLDNSRRMLEQGNREPCLVRILHDAERLPFLDAQFSCVTSFLCDPFLGLDFLGESFRVLGADGLFIATTPTLEWGHVLRRVISIDDSQTRFKTKAVGPDLKVPSALVSRERLIQMLEWVGFTLSRLEVTVLRLPTDSPSVSDDIEIAANNLACRVNEVDLLYLVVATK